LANPTVHRAFLEACRKVNDVGNAVGRYVIMPNHIHVRVGPGGRLGQAVTCMREHITKRLRQRRTGLRVWQAGFFDPLLRSSESYGEKWEYVRRNPVRAGLVRSAQEWPCQGEIVEIPF